MTAPMSEVDELRERVEGLTGPDRETDWLVLSTIVEPWNAGAEWEDFGYVDLDGHPPAEGQITVRRNGKVYYTDLAYFTASVDAVLALVAEKLPGWRLESLREAVTRPEWHAELHPRTGTGSEAVGVAKTPALALLSALLSALPTPNPQGSETQETM